MDELIDDLVAEQEALDAALDGIPAERWETPSPADGWLLRDCIAHLAEFDEIAAVVAEGRPFPRDGRPGQGVLSARQVDARALSIEELLGWWREARGRLAAALRPMDPRARLPWAGPPMSARTFATARLMECFSHGLDAIEAAGVERPDSDRLRHVAHLGYATRAFAYRTRGLEPNEEPLFVELIAPSGARWTWGPEDAANRVRGTAGDFCRVVTQRLHYLDTDLEATGDAAREFLEVAQAFAGPPGSGRSPRGER